CPGSDTPRLRQPVTAEVPCPPTHPDQDEKGSLRDIFAQGGDLDSPSYRETLTVYQHALKDLRNVMREDLGTPSLVDDVNF
ncbi:hypothetical protein ABZ345_47425, partial [Lentzea sp. NPDC005914]|uniref:hypothetical protein n=1 Tax=Lentzea sp. NPDC005914 TaxID=3154572 RepID=UPI00340C5F9F